MQFEAANVYPCGILLWKMLFCLADIFMIHLHHCFRLFICKMCGILTKNGVYHLVHEITCGA